MVIKCPLCCFSFQQEVKNGEMVKYYQARAILITFTDTQGEFVYNELSMLLNFTMMVQ